MKNQRPELREYLAIAVVSVLFISMSVLSFMSIQTQRGNARVVNYVGIVRGATQKLIKEELWGQPDDALIARLDAIINELITGRGANDLIVMPDAEYLANMRRVQDEWGKLKEEITAVRGGADGEALYTMSQSYFTLVDETVTLAELCSERQVARSLLFMWSGSAVFVIMIVTAVIYYIRLASAKRRAEALSEIAYVDTLTGIPNRSRCEQVIEAYLQAPPSDNIGVLMFDMNGLKTVNDMLGHRGGDRSIAEFGRILHQEIPREGFVGRYGGDEFLAILENAGEQSVREYLDKVGEKIREYNAQRLNKYETISYAVGGVVESPRKWSIEAMIMEADRRMYANKRHMNEGRL